MNIEFNFPDVGEWQPSNKEALIPLETAIMAMISSVDNVAEGLNNNKFEGEDVTFALMYIVTTSCKVGCLMQQLAFKLR